MELLLGDCIEVMNDMDPDSVDMVLTSPPYDNLRTYGSEEEFTFDKFKSIANGLSRVLKKGGVIVWVVGDGTIKGSETGTSFRQALYFKEVGLRLHDTMIYSKDGFTFPHPNKYHQIFEYMFVLSKGSPKTFNPIVDRRNKYFGSKISGNWRDQDGNMQQKHSVKKGRALTNKYGKRYNIWSINRGYMKSSKDKIAYKHPAIFPEQLAHDHILSWSNPGDVILDPMMGSGTTGKICRQLDRKFVGIEINEEYFKIAKQRVMID